MTIGSSGGDGCTTNTKNKSSTAVITVTAATNKPSRHKDFYYRLQRKRFVVIASCLILCVLGMNVVQIRQFRNLSSTNWVKGSTNHLRRHRKRHQPSFLLTTGDAATATTTTNSKTTATTSTDAQSQFLYVPPALQPLNKALPNTSTKYYHDHYQTKSFLLQQQQQLLGDDTANEGEFDAPSASKARNHDGGSQEQEQFLFVPPSVTTFEEEVDEEPSSLTPPTTTASTTNQVKDSTKIIDPDSMVTHETGSDDTRSSDDKNNRKTTSRQDETRRNNIRKNKEKPPRRSPTKVKEEPHYNKAGANTEESPPRRSPTKVKEEPRHHTSGNNKENPPRRSPTKAKEEPNHNTRFNKYTRRSPMKERVKGVEEHEEPPPPLLTALLSPLHLLEEDHGPDEGEKKAVGNNYSNGEDDGGVDGESEHGHVIQAGLFVPSLKHEYRVNRRRKKRKNTLLL